MRVSPGVGPHAYKRIQQENRKPLPYNRPHFVYYNFVRISKSPSVTPAVQTGLPQKPMTPTDLANLTDAYNATEKKAVNTIRMGEIKQKPWLGAF